MAGSKFKSGDRVIVAENSFTDPSRIGEEAIVLYSFWDRYDVGNDDQFSLEFLSDSKVIKWFGEGELELKEPYGC